MNQFEILMLLLCLVIFMTAIIINILIYKWTVRKATRRFIKPYFESRGFFLYDKQFPSLFSSGAFKQEQLFGIFIKGWPLHNTYINIHAKNKEGVQIKTTAKISTSFLRIKHVKYKDYD